MSPDAVTRYARHLVLKEIGGPGQNALLRARVAIIGAGGLGGPAGLYLAAAGVGHITLIDDDAVDLSNLQRQIQFQTKDIGQPKVDAMEQSLSQINPEVSITSHAARLTDENARELLIGHDVILNGVDDFASRFAINEACLALGIPLVSGALGRFDGQVSLFKNNGKSACYRCLVPDIPPDAQTCAQVGIIGALAGIIGSVMALETVKIITEAGEPLFGKLWLYDGLSAKSRIAALPRDPACPACAEAKSGGVQTPLSGQS